MEEKINELEKESTEELTKPTSAFSSAVVHAEEMELDPSTFRWKAFLAGPSGSGKTTALRTLPGKKLLIDFDNRSQTVAGFLDIDILRIYEPDPKSPKAWNRALAIKDVIASEIRQKIFPYSGVMFDGLTMMGRISLNWALTLDSGRGLGGSPARQHYGPQMDSLAKFVLGTLAFPIHIVYTGSVELIQDEVTGGHKFYPKITGKLRTEVAHWFNETFYCYRQPDDEGKLKYFWFTAGSGRKEFFKSSLNQLGTYWEDPIPIDYSAPGPHGFEDLFQRRFGSSKRTKKENKE